MCINDELPDTLYHYCLWETFEKIITNKTIRFSDVMKSNDSKEIIYLFELCRDKLKKEGLYQQANPIENEPKRDFEGQTYYTFCLSKVKDLLSQWRGYAPDGGVCIGFSTEKLKEWCKSITVLKDTAKIAQVEYISSGEEIQEFHDEKFASLENYEQLLELAPKYKNKGFAEEQEVRVYFKNFFLLEYGQRTLPEVEVKGKPCNIRYITKKKSWVKSYYDIPFDYDMINEIIIGPKLNMPSKEFKAYVAKISPEFYSFINAEKISVNKTKLSFR